MSGNRRMEMVSRRHGNLNGRRGTGDAERNLGLTVTTAPFTPPRPPPP